MLIHQSGVIIMHVVNNKTYAPYAIINIIIQHWRDVSHVLGEFNTKLAQLWTGQYHVTEPFSCENITGERQKLLKVYHDSWALYSACFLWGLLVVSNLNSMCRFGSIVLNVLVFNEWCWIWLMYIKKWFKCLWSEKIW